MIVAAPHAANGIETRAKLTMGVNSLPDDAVHPWRV
jgi:hypothetical protein